MDTCRRRKGRDNIKTLTTLLAFVVCLYIVYRALSPPSVRQRVIKLHKDFGRKSVARTGSALPPELKRGSPPKANTRIAPETARQEAAKTQSSSSSSLKLTPFSRRMATKLPPTDPTLPVVHTPPSPGNPLDYEILYIVKTCAKFQARAVQLYQSWGQYVQNIIFSTDKLLQRIPTANQRVIGLLDSESAAFMRAKPMVPRSQAASCAVTLQNLGVLLGERQFDKIKWLVVVDDDTFVVRDNIAEYLATMNHAKLYYLGFSRSEPLWWIKKKNGVRLRISATAPGIAYSKGILDRLRRNPPILNRTAVFRLCRRAEMGDDVALGLLVWFAYGVEVKARPDLFGYHWMRIEDPVEIPPLTMHTEQQFNAWGTARMRRYSAMYYGNKNNSVTPGSIQDYLRSKQ